MSNYDLYNLIIFVLHSRHCFKLPLMSNRTATTLSPFPRPSDALPYPRHGRRRMSAAMRSPCMYLKSFFVFRDLARRFFSSRPKYAIRGTWIPGQTTTFWAPASGGGSNAPRSAMSVPHIDVNEDGCRARQARSCKNTACRGGIPEIWLSVDVCSASIIYKNWQHYQCPLLFFILERYNFFFVVTGCETEWSNDCTWSRYVASVMLAHGVREHNKIDQTIIITKKWK